jgi:hypothetical protein
MTDRPLFILDAEKRWRLAFDPNQWVIQRKKGAARLSERSGIRDSGWRGVSFIGSEKRILDRCLRENGIILTPEARAAVDSLPETFLEWLAIRDRAEGA